MLRPQKLPRHIAAVQRLFDMTHGEAVRRTIALNEQNSARTLPFGDAEYLIRPSKVTEHHCVIGRIRLHGINVGADCVQIFLR